jgi:hypothetical protein
MRATEKGKEEERKFCGWGTTSTVDKSGESIKASDVAKVMPALIERGAPILLEHTNRVVGKIDSWELKKNAQGSEGIYLCGHIHKDYDVDDKVWNGIKSGKLGMLSIGGDISARKVNCDGGDCHIDLMNPEIYEFSVVPSGMNKESGIDYVNRVAKTDFKTVEECMAYYLKVGNVILNDKNIAAIREYCEKLFANGEMTKRDELDPEEEEAREEREDKKQRKIQEAYMTKIRERYKQVFGEYPPKDMSIAEIEDKWGEEYRKKNPPPFSLGAEEKTKAHKSATKELIGKAVDSASEAYKKTVASAEEAYDEAVAPAWEAYKKTVASAREAYDEAKAHKSEDDRPSFIVKIEPAQKSLDIKVKSFISEKKSKGEQRPDVWTMLKSCQYCRTYVQDAVSQGESLEKAVADLDAELDTLYKGDEKVEDKQMKKGEADDLAKMLAETVAKVEALEKAFAAMKNEQPAPAQTETKECPPGAKWDEAQQKCVQVQEAPVEAKSTNLAPESTKQMIDAAIAKALAERGVVQTSSPRPAIAKSDAEPMGEGSEPATITPEKLAEERMRRRASAIL